MYDVVALGELLIDFTPAGLSPNGGKMFEQNPGGAPANVVTCLAKLGHKTGFIGKVGDDQFGRDLREVLKAHHVSTEGLILDPNANTTLAFVHLSEDGDRSFSFYRSPGADTMLKLDEVRPELLETRIFHYGSLSLTHEPCRSTTLAVLRQMHERGVLLSYDPNLRPPLWDSLENAKHWLLEGMAYADVVKLSVEELEFLLGTANLDQGSLELMKSYGLTAVFVTLGADGCYYRVGEKTGRVAAFPVKVVDTTGAGDAFVGGMLHRILESNVPINQWDNATLEESVLFANAVGGLATTKKGAIPAMPELPDVTELIHSR